ncbi:hypothetical protein HQQ81_21355 [Microbacteriaceae bacterium VKM Ac-2854]|nr:hypothetical protein [Microbacteriaceae bacterium VKM Ac-2854]
MTPTLLPRIAALAAQVRDEVASIEWGRLTENERVELAVAWGGLERAVVGGAIGAAGAIEAACQVERGMDSLALRHGVRTGKQLLAMLTGSSEMTAGRRIRLAQAGMGKAVTSGWGAPALFPVMGQAVLAGTMHADAAEVLVSTLSGSAARIHPDELAVAEKAIVESATDPAGDANAHGAVTGTGIAAELVKIQALAWRARLDPDGLEPSEEEAFHLRNAVWRRGRTGTETLVLTVTTEQAAAIKSSLSPHTSPRKPAFRDGDNTREAAEGVVFGDDRTHGQKALDTVVALVVAGAASEAPTGATPQITAYVNADDLDHDTAGPAYLDHTEEPVPASSVRRLRCHGEVRIAILGDRNVTDALGRPVREFTPAQKKLLAALYGGCAWPGCTAPPAWTEAHHVHWHSRGGKTSVDNGVPLCAFHHHVIHANTGWEIVMKQTVHGLRAHLIPPFVIDPHRTPRPMGNPHRRLTRKPEDPDPPPRKALGD